jgi:predicted branched-subunit amino acid permease
VWNLMTLVGALGAAQLGNPDTYGLDVVGPAAFLALLWPRLRTGAAERRVAVLAALVAIATTPLLPPGIPVMLAAVAAVAGVLRRRSRPPEARSPEPALTGGRGEDS